MKTQRELLELAAKAAGFKINERAQSRRDALIDPETASLWIDEESTAWNPLRDDGAALRLAVKLRLKIDIERDRCCISVDDHSGRSGVQPWGADGPEAATRLAITRAAAAIGEAMP